VKSAFIILIQGNGNRPYNTISSNIFLILY